MEEKSINRITMKTLFVASILLLAFSEANMRNLYDRITAIRDRFKMSRVMKNDYDLEEEAKLRVDKCDVGEEHPEYGVSVFKSDSINGIIKSVTNEMKKSKFYGMKNPESWYSRNYAAISNPFSYLIGCDSNTCDGQFVVICLTNYKPLSTAVEPKFDIQEICNTPFQEISIKKCGLDVTNKVGFVDVGYEKVMGIQRQIEDKKNGKSNEENENESKNESENKNEENGNEKKEESVKEKNGEEMKEDEMKKEINSNKVEGKNMENSNKKNVENISNNEEVDEDKGDPNSSSFITTSLTTILFALFVQL